MNRAVTALLHRNHRALRIDLPELSRQQVEVLLQRVLQGPAARRTAHALFETSGGNALYLRELVLGAFDKGAITHNGIWEIDTDNTATTLRLRELIRQRLASAGPAGQPVLEAIAVCGTVSLAACEALADSAVLINLEEAGLIHVIQDEQRLRVRLTHPLYAETLRADVPLLRRRRILLDQVRFVETRGAQRQGDALDLSSWRLAATGMAEPAMLLQAATLALHGREVELAVRLLRALGPDAHTSRSRIQLGSALAHLGRFEESEEMLAQSDRSAGNPEEKQAAVAARVFNLFCWGRREEVREVIAAAQSAATTQDSKHELRMFEAAVNTVSGRPVEGMELVRDWPDAPIHTVDAERWLLGANVKATGLSLLGELKASTPLAELVYETHRKIDENTLLPHPSVHAAPLMLALSESGRLEESRAVGERAAEELLAAPSPTGLWVAHELGRTAWLAGRPLDASRWYSEAVAVSGTLGHGPNSQLYLAGLAAAAALSGQREAAEEAAAAGRQLQSSGFLSGEELLGEAWVHVVNGRLGEARVVLHTAAGLARSTGHLVSEVLLLTDLARLGEAEQVASRLTELAARCDGAFTAARARFVVALAEEIPDALMQVADDMEAMGARLLAAEAASAAVAAWQRAGGSREATAASLRAMALASQCQGARTPLLLAAGAGTPPLTTREKEIALLASEGASSKKIAETLYISTRTVDNHLQKIYAKLGVTSRRDLAGALGLTGPRRP
ncbi:LuxR C-terminal-related transcriptional regulator [Streptomyces sp. NPDC006879]|uniref:helix-turn-helix transcriptional regulator n=1 Tax=Streptomyces sp. NPDC006879 TaxID=3364767 RepID=UPI0036897E8C